MTTIEIDLARVTRAHSRLNGDAKRAKRYLNALRKLVRNARLKSNPRTAPPCRSEWRGAVRQSKKIVLR